MSNLAQSLSSLMKAISILFLATSFGFPLPAQSQALPFCYMKASTGQVIDLDSLCRQSLQSNQHLNQEQMFQQLIVREATSSDKAFLQSPGGMEEAIAKAKEFCADYNNGLTREQAIKAIAEESFIGGGSKKQNSYLALINAVATRVYCPEH